MALQAVQCSAAGTGSLTWPLPALRAEACPTLTNMLVIIVGGIPIAMPTVLSVTLALGAFKLAKEGAIVARMSAVEEMASMDILCSDKTGASKGARV